VERAVIWALHGFLGEGSDWDFLRQPLRAIGCELHAPSLFAASAAEEDLRIDPAGESLVVWTRRFIQYVAARDSSPVILGYSLGGRLALHLLAERSSTFKAGIIVSAGLGIEGEGERRRFGVGAEDRARGLGQCRSRLELPATVPPAHAGPESRIRFRSAASGSRAPIVVAGGSDPIRAASEGDHGSLALDRRRGRRSVRRSGQARRRVAPEWLALDLPEQRAPRSVGAAAALHGTGCRISSTAGALSSRISKFQVSSSMFQESIFESKNQTQDVKPETAAAQIRRCGSG
jgi:pimeloyl-ACP methyl ester carboxylesterase